MGPNTYNVNPPSTAKAWMINRRPSIWNKAACFVSAGVARTFECPPALNVHLHEHMSTFMSTARLYVFVNHAYNVPYKTSWQKKMHLQLQRVFIRVGALD